MIIKIPNWLIFAIVAPVVIVGGFYLIICLGGQTKKNVNSRWHTVQSCEQCDDIITETAGCCPKCGAKPFVKVTKVRRMVYTYPWWKLPFEEPSVEWKEK